jgi:hypothetical protein
MEGLDAWEESKPECKTNVGLAIAVRGSFEGLYKYICCYFVLHSFVLRSRKTTRGIFIIRNMVGVENKAI